MAYHFAIPAGPAALLFGIVGGLVGFFLAYLLRSRIPGRLTVLISATVAGISAELLSGYLGSLTGNGAVILTSRLIGLLVGGGMFRFTFRGHFGATQDWLGPYMASSFASWTAFAMSHELIGVASVLAAIIGGTLASLIGRTVSRYLPTTLEQASAVTQVAGISWVLAFISYSLGIVGLFITTGKILLTPFGIFAASSVALLLSFLFALPYVSSGKVYARLTERISSVWQYNGAFILLFLFVTLMILVGYQKSFSSVVLLIAVSGGIIAGVFFGTMSHYLSRDRRGIPPVAFSAVLLGISTGQGIGVIASLALDTFVLKIYTNANVLELVIVSGLVATIAGFIITVIRVRRKPLPPDLLLSKGWRESENTQPPAEEVAPPEVAQEQGGGDAEQSQDMGNDSKDESSP